MILIVQDLPAALVDIKPNRPLDGRQQMLREWRDYCLKTQWHVCAPLPLPHAMTPRVQMQRPAAAFSILVMLRSKLLTNCKRCERIRERERPSSPLPLLSPRKNRAAARWLYVVTAEAGVLGKPSMLLM